MFPLRDENPRTTFPFITLLLIGANGAIWFHQISLGYAVTGFVQAYALIPVELLHGANLAASQGWPPWTSLFTSMFLHGGWGHVVGNLWFLWIFGDNVEDILGHSRFLIFYLVTGVVAALAHVALNPSSSVPTLGASGAISGVLGAYFLLFPRIRVRTLLFLGFYITVVRVRAFLFLGLWFAFQAFGSWAQGSAATGVAFAAHLGGFVAGLVLILLWTGRNPAPPRYTYTPRRVRRS